MEVMLDFGRPFEVEEDGAPALAPIAALVHAANAYPWWSDARAPAEVDADATTGVLRVRTLSQLSTATVCLHVAYAQNHSYIRPELQMSVPCRLLHFLHDPLGKWSNTKRIFAQFDPVVAGRTLVFHESIAFAAPREIVPTNRTRWWNATHWTVGRDLVVDMTRQNLVRVHPHTLFPSRYLLYIGGVLCVRKDYDGEIVPWAQDDVTDLREPIRIIVEDSEGGEAFKVGVVGDANEVQAFAVDLRRKCWDLRWGPAVVPVPAPTPFSVHGILGEKTEGNE
jgi:hypothetical protein